MIRSLKLLLKNVGSLGFLSLEYPKKIEKTTTPPLKTFVCKLWVMIGFNNPNRIVCKLSSFFKASFNSFLKKFLFALEILEHHSFCVGEQKCFCLALKSSWILVVVQRDGAFVN
jgi:hypothetical protein